MEQRRSVRKYKNQPVQHELVREIIQAAILAPSWKNSQVSRYYVAEGNAAKELAKCLADFNQRNVQNAPVLIVSTVVNKRSGFTRDGEYETHLKDGFQYYDHGMQATNLCLKAHDLGLATLIMGIYDEAAIRKFFNIDENQIIVAVIAVGYADGETLKPKRKTVDDITVFKS
jgi:hypothetical protein